ncbi:MAG: hypothetical protein IKV94_04185 [Clostridia bacterium]|nr:hypothetical protein [Clostridia bacterium]
MKYKQGITVVSLVVYVILLFGFITITLTVSGNFSSNLFDEKGSSTNLSNFDKLLYYLNESASTSTDVDIVDNEIAFSNGDVYTYNEGKSTVYLNGGILVKDVTNFSAQQYLTSSIKVECTFTKYTSEISRSINVYVGEW